ncbi:hypothetical protein GHT06_011230 [Daphnia sinensis]|uniref:Uncharacterized protein n=1 Tax=Daphnia sinensis TaxID=1820382 RepID=A0AAD5KZR2_9CRUS|nr:hypothetical protein GHT06_011230 [Daphnia sinensis]
MKVFALLLLVGVSVVYSAPQNIEFAIIDVINSAVPNVAINIPTAAVRPVVNIPAVPPQGGASAFASAQGRPGSQTFASTNIQRGDDDDRK